MQFPSLLPLALLLVNHAAAANVTVPSTCTGGFSQGSDTVIYTVPYTYQQVLSIIGSYKNLTWSGNPDNTVTLNGTDNTVGTARTYDIDGAHVIETILTYEKPANGPYVEVHNTATLSIPSAMLTGYIPFDGTVVKEVCGGRASQFNFTAHYCANNATAFGAALHMLHMNDAVTVGKFLGGMNFSSCANLGGASNGTATVTSMLPLYTGGAVVERAGMGLAAAVLAAAALSLYKQAWNDPVLDI